MMELFDEFFASGSDEAEFVRVARALCDQDNIEKLTEFLDYTAKLKLSTWGVFDAGLKISAGLPWDWDRAKTVPKYDKAWMPRFLRGLDTFRLVWDDQEEVYQTNKINFLTLPDRCKQDVFVVSCDGSYLTLFSQKLIESFLISAGPNDGLHIHCCNIQEDVLEPLLDKETKGITFSTETIDQVAPAYHACSRFFVAHAMMKNLPYRSRIHVLDFDIRFESSPHELFSFEPAIRGRRLKAPKLPWQVYIANYTSFYRCAAASSYLSTFEKITLPLLYRSDIEHWYLDQNALSVLMYKEGFLVKNDWVKSGQLFRAVEDAGPAKDQLR